jgi:DNA-binding response OmpR family regulator
LVVDDEIDTAQSLAWLLRDMGHTVEFAMNGRGALKVAGRFTPEIVLLDMVLPDMDGVDLSRLLRIQAQPNPIRIIAVTGRRSDSIRRSAIEAGCEHFLLKPLDPKLIESLLRA